MKANQTKKQLDLFALFYGIGAAILITGMLFKYLAIPFADKMFVLGLAVEAIIFIVSSVSWKTQESKYRWEKVFPQLENEDKKDAKDDVSGVVNVLKQNLEDQRKLFQEISGSLQDVRNSMDNLSKELERTVPHVNNSLSDVRKQLDNSKSIAQNLSNKLGKVNNVLEQK